jgi:hypothetical protein
VTSRSVSCVTSPRSIARMSSGHVASRRGLDEAFPVLLGEFQVRLGLGDEAGHDAPKRLLVQLPQPGAEAGEQVAVQSAGVALGGGHRGCPFAEEGVDSEQLLGGHQR